MIELLLKTLWFFLPAGLANMSPVIFKWIPFLNYPIDFNKKFKGQPLLGINKTFRGLILAILVGIATVYFQRLFYPQMISVSIIDYTKVNIYLLGFLLGFGAIFGDIVASFFKRRLNILPGKSWFPFDQIDWIVGSIILTSFYVDICWKYLITSFILLGFMHLIVNLTGYHLKIKRNKF